MSWFVGRTNFIPARIEAIDPSRALAHIRVGDNLRHEAVLYRTDLAAGDAVRLSLRPEDIVLAESGIAVRVTDRSYLGDSWHVGAAFGDTAIVFDTPKRTVLPVGAAVHVRLEPHAGVTFPSD